MTSKYTVWLVDDLAKNRRDFETNHASDFDVKTFAKPSEVLSRISRGECPDALLIDVFFYDTEEQAQKAEEDVAEQASKLREAAAKLGLLDHRYAAGITLMENIYKHFKKHPPDFPMYAYTSKGPFLLEQKDWQKISEYGAQVLLKGRVSPQSEVTEIVGHIEIFRTKKSWRAWFKRVVSNAAFTLWPGLFWLVVGSAGAWLLQWMVQHLTAHQ
jgi:hypothetical protein